MGYRILNASLTPRFPCRDLRPDEKPEMIYTEIRGKKFAFDCNSLALLLVDSIDDYLALKNNPPSPHIMARYKPVFHPSGAPEKKVSTLVLEATHGCNLACRYCFVSLYPHRSAGGDNMTFEVAKRAIDELVDTRGYFSTGFFGGEPMTQWPLIVKVTEYVEQIARRNSPVCKQCGGSGRFKGEKCPSCLGLGKQRPGLHITTNGTLFTPERVAFLNDHGYSLIVSIDGTDKSHDQMRPYADGRPSWHKVMEGLKLMKGTRLAQSCTLRSTFGVNSNETIRDRLEYLNQCCDDGMGSWVSVEPVALSHDSPLKNQGIEITKYNAWERFEEEYLDAAEWWVERAQQGKTPRWHNVFKTIERIFYTIHSCSECGAGRGYLSVNGKGQIFSCHREGQSYLGDLGSGIDEQLRTPWLENRVYNRKGCMSCPVRWTCGGGCREDSLSCGNDISVPDPCSCALKQLWVHSAFLIMAGLSKETLAKYVKDPGPPLGNMAPWCQYVPTDRVRRDESGFVIPSYQNNIPVTALVRPGEADTVKG